MSKIIPGCMVMVVGHPVTSNNGKAATAIKYVGDAATDTTGRRGLLTDYWEIDRSLQAYLVNPETGAFVSDIPVMVRYCSERFLVRIDGFIETEEQEQVESVK